MQVEAFWKHWKVREDPFRAEEARDDPVLARMVDSDITHPDFQKVFGTGEKPSAAVVFGEKGSGKTALRLLLEKRYAEYNAAHPDAKMWVVRYDDLNPVLDRFAQSAGSKRGESEPLDRFRLADHQDAILALLTTKLVNSLLNDNSDAAPLPPGYLKTARRMTRNRRVDLAVLAALYDQPRSGNFPHRWARVARITRLSWLPRLASEKWMGLLMLIVAAAVYIASLVAGPVTPMHTILISIGLAAAVLLLGHWSIRCFALWSLVRKIRREMAVINRTPAELRTALAEFTGRELQAVHLPKPGDTDSRYQLTHRLLEVLDGFGFKGVIVLIDRVDEPAMINGDPRKMRSLVWPLFNNKFLQQDRVGIKMLLPIELRHLLRKEDAEFFQQARLDKQHMIDKLLWSGATLYDVCTRRLQACMEDGALRIGLTDLFEPDVARQDLIDALDQMQQPRDSFKFLYQVIQEHCSNVPQDQPVWRIPRATLNHIRKHQSQRVQELQRGLTPA